jgi:hypothetical protein
MQLGILPDYYSQVLDKITEVSFNQNAACRTNGCCGVEKIYGKKEYSQMLLF